MISNKHVRMHAWIPPKTNSQKYWKSSKHLPRSQPPNRELTRRGAPTKTSQNYALTSFSSGREVRASYFQISPNRYTIQRDNSPGVITGHLSRWEKKFCQIEFRVEAEHNQKCSKVSSSCRHVVQRQLRARCWLVFGPFRLNRCRRPRKVTVKSSTRMPYRTARFHDRASCRWWSVSHLEVSGACCTSEDGGTNSQALRVTLNRID